MDQEGPPDDEDEEDLALEANEDGASKKWMMRVLTQRIHDPCMVDLHRFTNIYHENQPNVGKYAIRGSYGLLRFVKCVFVFACVFVYSMIWYVCVLEMIDDGLLMHYIPTICFWAT